MLFYGAKRLGLALIICIIAMSMLFIAIRAIPGDPATMLLGSRADMDDIAAAIRKIQTHAAELAKA